MTVLSQVTMPKRGKPEPPLLNYGNYGLGGLLGDSGILEWDTSKEYLLSWQLPEDNGLPIDMFLLRYFPVSVTHRDSMTCDNLSMKRRLSEDS